MKQSDYFVHPTAVIDEGCQIGKGTKIWHFFHLMGGCTIGEECSLGQNVFVGSNVILGRNVKVQNNVSIYEGVVCEDDVFLVPPVVFTKVFKGYQLTRQALATPHYRVVAVIVCKPSKN